MNEPNKKLIIPDNIKFQEYFRRPRVADPRYFDTWIETETKFFIYHYFNSEKIAEWIILK